MESCQVSTIDITMCDLRGVAQPGSAPAWGVGGRWFKSSRPDQKDFGFCWIKIERLSLSLLFIFSCLV